MYANNTVIYVHAKSKQQAAQELTTVMVQVTKWLIDSCLHLNMKKTFCMLFTKRTTDATETDVYVSGETLHVVSVLITSASYLIPTSLLKAGEKGN